VAVSQKWTVAIRAGARVRSYRVTR